MLQYTTKDVGSVSNDSTSKGWSMDETQVLRQCIKKFGYGCWDKIIRLNLIPGKTHSQLYHHTMRLCGQQSLSHLKGIHFDTKDLYLENLNKTGENIKRKGGLIIYGKSQSTEEEKVKMRKYVFNNFALSKSEIENTRILRLKFSGNDRMRKEKLQQVNERLGKIEEAIKKKKKKRKRKRKEKKKRKKKKSSKETLTKKQN